MYPNPQPQPYQPPTPPNALHAREGAAIAPAIVATITGGAAAVVAAWACLTFEFENPLQWILGAFVLGFVIIWGFWLRHYFKSLAPGQAAAVPMIISKPGTPPKFTVWIENKSTRSGEEVNFSASPERMITLAKGLLAGRPMTRATWCAEGNGLLSDPEQRKIRKEMLDRGILEFKIPGKEASGTKLTDLGRQVLEGIAAGRPPAPPPQDDDY